MHAGLFVSLMLRYDTISGSGKKTYFYSAMVGYMLGLIVTLIVMYSFKAAQPALLYIVPGIAGAVFAQAMYRGEVYKLWNFSDEEATATDAKGPVGDGTAADGDAPSIEPKKEQ
jgi:minor histocompatibility antigen H13